MANIVFKDFLANAVSADIYFDSVDWKVILLKEGASISTSATTYSDIQDQELADGNGYTQGGATLENRVITVNDTETVISGDNVVWNSCTFTVQGYAIYADNANKDLLVAQIDDNATSVDNGDFTIEWDINGIIVIQ